MTTSIEGDRPFQKMPSMPSAAAMMWKDPQQMLADLVAEMEPKKTSRSKVPPQIERLLDQLLREDPESLKRD